MEDLKKIQEFFSKPLDENRKLTYNDFVRMVRDDMMAGAAPDEIPSEKLVASHAKAYYNEYLQGASVDDMFEAETNVSDDIPDIIAVDVPLFIRLLEFAREDAGDDMDLHEVAERAIEAVKARGVLSMDDYETLVPPKEELKEDSFDDVLKKKIDLAQAWLDRTPTHSVSDRGSIEGWIKKAKENPFQANMDWKNIKKILDPNGQLLKEIIYNNIRETIKLGEGVIEEELCPKGKAYIKRRKAAGEKSSAYLSGRAVKVCKGQMSGRSKKKVNEEAVDEADARDKASMAFDKMKVGNTIKTSKGEFKKVDDKHFEMIGKPGRKFTAKQMTYITPPAK